MTKTVLETALEAEMSEHLGYDRHDPSGRDGGNSRNGTRTKTVLTEIGPVQIEVPRDRDARFDLVIVRKRQRRLDGIDKIVLSLTARGLTTGEVAAPFEKVYGAKVSRDTISRITDKVLEEMAEWADRPLDVVYPVIFVDAIHVKVRVLAHLARSGGWPDCQWACRTGVRRFRTTRPARTRYASPSPCRTRRLRS